MKVYYKTRIAAQLLASTLLGMIFGIALEKCRVFEPNIINEQFVLKNFTMVKMFLSAIVIGMVSFCIIKLLPDILPHYEIIVDDLERLQKNMSKTGAAIGGLIFGCGMALSGSCPGIALVQMGAGVPNAGFTYMGEMLGMIFYAIFVHFINKMFMRTGRLIIYTIDDLFDYDYPLVAIPVIFIFYAIALTLEVFIPWESEVEQGGGPFFEAHSWPPFVSGILIGLLQIPTIMSVNKPLGCTVDPDLYRHYKKVIKKKNRKKKPIFLDRKRRKIKKKKRHHKTEQKHIVRELLYMGGAVFGAAFSASCSNSFGTVSGYGSYRSMFGGFLLSFGDKITRSCISGHGLTGLSLLMVLPLVAVPCTFIGGILTTYIYYYLSNFCIYIMTDD